MTVVGGLHNWIKFYLEERRGAAKYLGHRYPGRLEEKEGLENPRFVSGRFTWDFEGRHLVKDVGGFFVGQHFVLGRIPAPKVQQLCFGVFSNDLVSSLGRGYMGEGKPPYNYVVKYAASFMLIDSSKAFSQLGNRSSSTKRKLE